MAEKTLTAQERGQLFAMSTRQNIQMMPKQSATSGATSLQFNLPKARLLSKITMRVKATVTATHASSTSLSLPATACYKLLRRVSLDLNNGFSPFVLSGDELAMYNMIDKNGDLVAANAGTYNAAPASLTVSSTGTDNTIAFTAELPVTLSPASATGLILLQNDQTNVTLTCDVANATEMFATTQTGYTINLKQIDITPCVETFSIPASVNAYPDLSVLKLVNGRNDAIPATGQHVVKLSTGTIYRKIIFMLEDANGSAFADSDLSDIQLVFNQADINYAINPEMLRVMNTRDLGFTLPAGCFCLDFSAAGNLPNYGGIRDVIDTEKLTEFWLRFNTTKTGKIKVVTECLARLN